MFVVLYSWRIKPDLEQRFIDSWSEITQYFIDNFDSLGSRLHRGSNGIWYAYAQWKSAEQRENASIDASCLTVRNLMRDSIEESFPEVRLEIEKDYLIPA